MVLLLEAHTMELLFLKFLVPLSLISSVFVDSITIINNYYWLAQYNHERYRDALNQAICNYLSHATMADILFFEMYLLQLTVALLPEYILSYSCILSIILYYNNIIMFVIHKGNCVYDQSITLTVNNNNIIT